jgi:hypothetical protein
VTKYDEDAIVYPSRSSVKKYTFKLHVLQVRYYPSWFFRDKWFLGKPNGSSSTLLSMLCAQEEMEMANSQGKKEEITPAAIFVIIVGIVVKVAIAVRWESACVMMWHLI